jgi:putative transposase
MSAAQSLARSVGTTAACEALGVPRSSLYRRRSAVQPSSTCQRPKPVRALSEQERGEVLATLHREDFVDQAPSQVYAALLDQGTFLCSIRTMYRILADHDEVRERRNQLRHPRYPEPRLVATAPKQVWSWDITKLLGPAKWTYFYLYVILDLFSRYVVGWMVARREQAGLAQRLIRETCEKEDIWAGELALHADRGPAMIGKPVAQLLADLGVTKSHSRPRVMNDNPYSEAQFKTLKYRPEFPQRFGCLEDARSFCRAFFTWYNHEHYHSGVGLMTPAMVHYGRAEEVRAQRQLALDEAYLRHPERFVRKPPQAPSLPTAVWINPPARKSRREDALQRDISSGPDPQVPPESPSLPARVNRRPSPTSPGDLH